MELFPRHETQQRHICFVALDIFLVIVPYVAPVLRPRNIPQYP